MLAHQIGRGTCGAMELQAEAQDLMRAYKRSGYTGQPLDD